LSVGLRRERVALVQALALAASCGGIGVIVSAAGQSGHDALTPLGIALVLCSGAAWAVANLIVASAGRMPVLPFMVWSSAFTVPPLALLSCAFDPPGAARGPQPNNRNAVRATTSP
jgi:O-acetylserine/cysteine efflux transporter